MTKRPTLTTTAGSPVADNQNSATAGPRGPILMQDYQLIEKLAHQNRERIPERVVHAKGSAAFGELEITEDISQYSLASVFKPDTTSECLLRFSTVAGERGAADAERDVRGWALKVYTDQGNWDLVGNNTPVFFIRDPYKFPDFIRTQKRMPDTNMRSSTAMWDFWSLSPESLHQVTILFSDRGLPKSFRHVNGYGSHTYSLINDAGERVWCKFHFKTQQGHEFWTNREAEEVVGRDRESSQRDLFETIARGEFPRWKFQIQVMTQAQANETSFNPFDLTKIWPHAEFPMIDVGVLELNRNPQNYHAEVEQASFSPSNVVPGISWSPDKVLQARIFAYGDAHRYRVGTNYEYLPVNKPKVSVNNYIRDGAMRFDGNGGSAVNYEPNSFDGPAEAPQYREPPLPIEADFADRYNHRDGNDDYTQPGDLFRLMDDGQQSRLMDNIAEAMDGVPKNIQIRQIAHFFRADPDYGIGVATRLDLSVNDLPVTEAAE